MIDDQPDAATVARRIADELEHRGIPYAIGGAIAYGYFGAARGTKDVDVNLFLAPDDARPALDALTEVGVDIDVERAVQRGRERGDAIGYYGLTRVDVFFNSIELHEAAAQRTRTVTLLGQPIRVLSPEDTDRAEIRRWIVDGVGVGDPRVQRWDALCEALPLPSG